ATVSATPSVCKPAYIGVPGSGQSGFSRDTTDVGTYLLQTAGQDVGIVDPSLPYPAVAWYRYVIPWNNLERSEVQGIINLTAEINKLQAGDCAQRTILLAGYSQGAEVVIRTVNQLPESVRNTLAIALLGDPSFTPNQQGSIDYNKAGQGIRPTFHMGRYVLPADVLS